MFFLLFHSLICYEAGVSHHTHHRSSGSIFLTVTAVTVAQDLAASALLIRTAGRFLSTASCQVLIFTENYFPDFKHQTSSDLLPRWYVCSTVMLPAPFISTRCSFRCSVSWWIIKWSTDRVHFSSVGTDPPCGAPIAPAAFGSWENCLPSKR